MGAISATTIQIAEVIVTGVVGLVSVAAICVAPIVALKLEKASDSKQSLKKRQLELFHTLMRYRATPLSVPFVQALNSIDLEFASNNNQDRAIRDAWTNLLDHFSHDKKDSPDFDRRSQDLTITLLSVMGTTLGFNFNETYLKRHSYYPIGHDSIERESHELRRLLLNLLRGNAKLPIAVFEERFPDLAAPQPTKISEEKHVL
jgi:hypothetical protein